MPVSFGNIYTDWNISCLVIRSYFHWWAIVPFMMFYFGRIFMKEDKKLGAQQICSTCGMYNTSGLKLPDECYWCNSSGEITLPDDFKVIEDEY